MDRHPATIVPPRGNRQRQRTRSALLQAGQRLLATRPLEGITIDDIVTEAEVAKGSFYNHFDDKAHLARSVQELIQGDCEFHIFSANADVEDAPARIARALCVVLRYALEHPERLQAMLSLAERKTIGDTPLNVGVRSDVRRGIESGRLKLVDQETGVLVVLGLVNVTVTHLTSGDCAQPARELGARMGAAMLHGMGVDPDEARAIADASADDILGHLA